MRSMTVTALSLSLILGACGDGPEPAGDPPDAQSAYVDLYLGDDLRGCGRQLDAYDRFIERIFDFWTVGELEDFRVSVHVSHEPRCPWGAVACADPQGVYLANQFGQYHELVHAMHFATDDTSANSVVEGLATALGPGHPIAGDLGDEIEVDVLFEPVGGDYSIYGVFTRFLIERHGVDSFRTYFRGMADPENRAPGTFEREFELAFGEPLDAVWPDFLSASRCAYDFWYCDERRPIELPFEIEGIDCDDPDVLGFESPGQEWPDVPFGPLRLVHLDNPVSQVLRVEVESVSVNLGRCGSCSEQSQPVFQPEFPGSPIGQLGARDQRRAVDLWLEAGTYAFIVMQPTDRPTWFSISEVE